MARVITLEKHLLSNGDTACVKRLGRKYYFERLHPSFTTPPETTPNTSKNEAMKLLADCLKADVLESD